MKGVCAIALSVSVLFAGCGDSSKGNSSGNPVTAPVDYLGAVNKAQKSANKAVDLATVQKAIQLFQAQEDRFPNNLQELVTTRYLQEVPEAPSGSRLNYDPATGQVKFVKAQ